MSLFYFLSLFSLMYLVQMKHFWSLGFLFVPEADNPVTFPPLSSSSPTIDIPSSVDRVQLQP